MHTLPRTPITTLVLACIAGGASAGQPSADMELEVPLPISLDEVVVTGSADSAAAQIERQSTAVTDALSIADLARTGDSDIAASLKRIAGVSVQGERFAVVRGLAARYLSTTLNGDLMASTNPYRRDVELDLFPASVLSGIEIQKSFSADLPGDTTGGAIRILTRGIASTFQAHVSAELGGTTGTSGRNIFTYRGGSRDWLGVDDGIRGLPADIDRITSGGRRTPSAADSRTYAPQLANIYDLRRTTAPADLGVSASIGDGFPMSAGVLGYYAAASYSHGAGSHQQGTRSDPRNVTRSDYSRATIGTATDGYLVLGYEADAGWNLYSRTLLLRRTEDTAEFESGFDIDDTTDFTDSLLEFTERQFLSQQVSAGFTLFDAHALSLRAGISRTLSDTPDRRSYRYQNQRFVSTSLERLYADLKEDALDLGVDYVLPLELTDRISMQVKAGGLVSRRDRRNDLVRLGIAPVEVSSTAPLEALLTPENFASGAYRLYGVSTDTDSYAAGQDATAGYVSTETDFGESFTLVAGLRQDNFRTTLRFPFSPGTPEAQLESDELLPALAMTYRFSDALQLRGAFSRTVSRPSISELSPSVFFDDRGRRFTGCTRQTIRGLEACKASTIDNFDTRVEYYFNRRDSVTLAAFHKQIDNPLERGLLGGTAGFTYRNSDRARVSGVELDGQFSWFAGSGHDFTLGANLSLIDSKISLDTDGQRIEGISGRALQGQSPVLANTRITWDHRASRQTATLSVNYYDDRIDVAGGNGLQPVYEKGRRVVNLTWEKQFGSGSAVGLKLTNLLDDDNVFVQRDTAGTRAVIERWRSGVGAQVSYTHEF